MKKTFIGCFFLIFIVEIVALIIFSTYTPNYDQDAVAINEIVQTVTTDFSSLDKHTSNNDIPYVVINNNEEVLYESNDNISKTINEAVRHRDTILNIEIDGNIVGKIIIYNDSIDIFNTQKQIVIIVLSVAITIQCAIVFAFVTHLYKSIVRPFRKLEGFAERVSSGNLDIPLEMDEHNLFGAFTESFDIMRSELKKARLAEAQAKQSKKELVAKLSHDIKTPVASIIAVSEVGVAVTETKTDQKRYEQIVSKANQINTLITNLFTATLEELQQLTVIPTDLDSKELKTMLENSDYLNRSTIQKIPECLVYADKLRLQQVFDNIFANSYKYARTDIEVNVSSKDNYLYIIIEDSGGGVPNDELPYIKEKFKRGSNSSKSEGAGLGLFISDYFLKEMHGDLKIENGKKGLKVTIVIALSPVI